MIDHSTNELILVGKVLSEPRYDDFRIHQHNSVYHSGGVAATLTCNDVMSLKVLVIDDNS